MKPIALLISIALCACETPLQRKAHDIATSNIPGKREPDACLPYAKALQAKLKSEGIESRIIASNIPNPRPGSPLLGHAVVVYRVDGWQYGMSNTDHSPTPIPEGLNDMEMMRHYREARGGNPFDVVATYEVR
jgi:hypothetical protein